MNKVVVIIPLYKPQLDDFETLSFLHNVNILKLHRIIAVCPKGLDVSFYKSIAPEVSYCEFKERDFSSVKKYNRLLISPRFYKQFSGYEYMLICHFDAWVFQNTLSEWCDKQYDYIGAPFLKPFFGKTSTLLPFLSTICINKIGNGGLSLRKISTHIKITERLWWLRWIYFYNEDVFFTLFPPLVLRRYCRPSLDEANRFAIEHYPEECMSQLEGALPFGCHGWFKKDFEFWSKYVNQS